MAKNSKPKNYKEMSKELNTIIDWFENAEPDVEEALIKYEQASEILEQMEKYLKTAKNKIKKIKTTP